MILPQANDGANAIHVESGLAVEEDFSSDKVDNDNITVANGHNLHGQTAVIEMARADDLRVGDVHAAGQASVGNVEQVDLISAVSILDASGLPEDSSLNLVDRDDF